MFTRYGLYAGTIIASLVGLLLLPAAFHAIAQHDVQISDRVSLLATVWLVVGLALSVYLLGARGAMLNHMSAAIRARLDNLQHPNTTKSTPESSGRSEADLPVAGAATAARLLDIVFLLVIQAIVRPPLVGVGKALAPEAWVDGGYVVLVVLIALALLINVRGVSRPLLDHLLWLGLDQAVPTAGFVSSNASETFTRLTATATTASTRSGPPSGLPASTQVAPGTEPTIAAPNDLSPTVLEASAAMPVQASEAVEATVVAPRSESAEATVADVRPASSVNGSIVETPKSTKVIESIIASPDESVESTLVGGPTAAADETLPPEKIRQQGQSEGER